MLMAYNLDGLRHVSSCMVAFQG